MIRILANLHCQVNKKRNFCEILLFEADSAEFFWYFQTHVLKLLLSFLIQNRTSQVQLPISDEVQVNSNGHPSEPL